MSKLFQYRVQGVDFLAVIKNGLVIDIACSSKWKLFVPPDFVLVKGQPREPGGASMFSKKTRFTAPSTPSWMSTPVKDLALYTHWPVHTKEFWDLLNETL